MQDGVWMVWWMKYQIFFPILLLLCLNLFWYFLILRIAFRYASIILSYHVQAMNSDTQLRAITDIQTTDDRSDDEDGGEDNPEIEVD